MTISMEMEQFCCKMDRYSQGFGMRIWQKVKVHLQQKMSNKFMGYGKEIDWSQGLILEMFLDNC